MCLHIEICIEIEEKKEGGVVDRLGGRCGTVILLLYIICSIKIDWLPVERHSDSFIEMQQREDVKGQQTIDFCHAHFEVFRCGAAKGLLRCIHINS